jgi:diguanylate cyclase (GGDEF)-like protein
MPISRSDPVIAPAQAAAPTPLGRTARRLLGLGVVLVVLALAGLTAAALWQQAKALTGPQRYNDLWTMHRAVIGLERLGATVSRVRSGAAAEGDALAEELERMLGALDARDKVGADLTAVLADMPKVVTLLQSTAAEVRGWLGRAGSADPIERIAISDDIQAQLPTLREQLQNAAMDVQFTLAQRIDQDRRDQRDGLITLAATLAAWVACMAAIIGYLLWSRRRVARAARVATDLNRALDQRVEERTRELDEHQVLLAAVLEASPSDVALSDAATGRLYFANDRLLARLGLPAGVRMLPIEHLLDDPQDGAQLVAELDRSGRIDGHQAWMAGIPPYAGLVSARKLTMGGLPAYLMWSVDISERVALESRLREASSTDALSGLLDRPAFLAQCDEASARCNHGMQPCALLMIDIDDFRRINDTHGHHVGDEVIRSVGAMLRELARDSDIVGRVGGEEFAVMLPDTTLENATRVARRLHAAVTELRLAVDGTDALRFTSSIGVADASTGERGVDALLQRTEAALREAKRNGRNRIETAQALGTPG